MSTVYQSWGRYPKADHEVIPIYWRGNCLPPTKGPNGLLCYGLGRSYGDCCLNDGGRLLATRGLNRFIRFDAENGVLGCESGVSLDEVLRLTVPKGWFLPVTPGTSFVTIGGAIANDVHGKNHHKAGAFGNFVDRLCLLRSDGSRLICSEDSNPALFRATIGGLGLTGLIEWAEFRLTPICNAYVDVETIRFGDLSEFIALSRENEAGFDYLVAWIDGTASGRSLGRGLFLCGNHNSDPGRGSHDSGSASRISLPVDLPSFVLNPLTVRAFNELYYRKQIRRESRAVAHFRPFFYPLDAIGNWNRLYGSRGLLQWQCLVPLDAGIEVLREILSQISGSGIASFLGVMKTMGSVPSRGPIAFSGRGVTLALDFQMKDNALVLLRKLSDIVAEAGGRIYAAKDACMTPEHFQTFYPRWRELETARDPAFSSNLWRRVTSNS